VKSPELVHADPEAQEHQAKAADRPKVMKRKSLSARGIHDTLLLEGREEINRRWQALAFSGLAAGLSMGLSLIAQGALRHYLPENSWQPAVAKLGYAVGFIAVMLGRQKLFTETTLTGTLPWAQDRTAATLVLVVRLWLILLVANLAGGWLFAAAAAHTTAFSPELRESFFKVGEEAVRHDFATAFVKGIFGGWLIALMVWLLPSAGSAKLWVIVITTWLLAVTEMTHIIAGSVEILYVVSTGALSFGTYLTRYAVPVLVGNTVGGIVFVAALNYAQVTPDEEKKKAKILA